MSHDRSYPDPPPETQARIKARMQSETRGMYAFVGFIGLILILAAYFTIEGMK